MPRDKENQVAFTVTLSKELNKKFEEFCKKNHRSKNAQCTYLIERALEEEKVK